ncbi:galactose-3-O-sulfotransferase 3 [Elysia marginata]|uniref:Galactose-3-O-sulfotransferase 3 n=1 Tax=Elysia marginata TaxID=1093978 RepID=A0AAV4G930_9GAST|nr:galactose-3-O-sulfotransferase 3 [Elysia marginata]
MICLKNTTSRYILQSEQTEASSNLTASPFTPPQGTRREAPPVQHVYYVKIHKAASSTIFAILAEYCRSHDLLPLLPIWEHINQQTPLVPKHQLMLNTKVNLYDMVFHHHVYDPAIFRYLHNDTFKVTMLREPFRHFVSSFMYFKNFGMKYLRDMDRYEDPISTFLQDPAKFEAEGFASYTNNRQCVDLGYDIRNQPFSNEDYIDYFIKETEKRFDLILITEYFMESIVLLRRALNWQTQDVLFYVKNAFAKSHTVLTNMTDWHRARHKAFSQPDIRLYEHFLAIFKQRMSATVGLREEVSELSAILEKVRCFCDQKNIDRSRHNSRPMTLHIPAGRWSGGMSISKSKCMWLKSNEGTVTRNLQISQKFLLARV